MKQEIAISLALCRYLRTDHHHDHLSLASGRGMGVSVSVSFQGDWSSQLNI